MRRHAPARSARPRAASAVAHARQHLRDQRSSASSSGTPSGAARPVGARRVAGACRTDGDGAAPAGAACRRRPSSSGPMPCIEKTTMCASGESVDERADQAVDGLVDGNHAVARRRCRRQRVQRMARVDAVPQPSSPSASSLATTSARSQSGKRSAEQPARHVGAQIHGARERAAGPSRAPARRPARRSRR